MRGDFSRFTFNPLNNYLSVLKQQGRIDLDADWNEQAEIGSEILRQLTADILGQFAVPLGPNEITPDNSRTLAITDFTIGKGGVIDFKIGHGIAYVGGYQLRLPVEYTYRSQADLPEPEMPTADGDLLVYVEVWKKSVNYIDDELIREPALGGPDTCLRAKAVGQVKVITVSGIADPHGAFEYLSNIPKNSNMTLTLGMDQSAFQIPLGFGEIEPAGGPIPGNLHFRLELHRGITSNGTASEGLKWSDENAAVMARIIRNIDNKTFLVDEPEPIIGESFKADDWIEISNSASELRRQGSQITRISNIENVEEGVMITTEREIHPMLVRRKNGGREGLHLELSPRLRRWSGYISPLASKTVYDLGQGVKAIFGLPERKHFFDPGDYWTFALRDRNYNKMFAPQKALPSGICKHRHPLAIIRRAGKRQAGDIIDCRRFFKPIAGFPT
jgi:hypothetical protein